MSHGGGNDRWLVSYADFITLLMVLFVVLYSMGQIDMKKYKAVAAGFQQAFSPGGGGGSLISPSISAGGVDPNEAPSPIVIEGLPKSNIAAAQTAEELSNLLEESNLANDLSMESNIEGSLISLSEKLLFNAGTIDMSPEAYPILDSVSVMLGPLDNDIKLMGYTDNTPSSDPRYATLMELSTARAYVAASYMISKGIDPSRIIISGRGEYNPIFPNDSAEHQALNNRVEIVVIYPQEVSDVINLSMNSSTNSNSTTLPTAAPQTTEGEGGE